MKRIGLLVLALLTVCGLTLSAVPALPAAAQPAPPSAQAVEELATKGLTPVAENAALILYADSATGNAALYHKAEGVFWYTNPPEYLGEKPTGQEKVLASAQMKITFYDKQFVQNELISTVGSLNKGGMTCQKTADGVQFTYRFPQQGITVPLRYTLRADYLEVSVPMDGVKEEGEYTLSTIAVLPFFGSGAAGDEGYLLVPDGSGALIDFADASRAPSAYAQPIYGRDRVTTKIRDTYASETARLPVLGIHRQEGGLLVVADKGAGLATANAQLSNLKEKRNMGYFSFLYRPADRMTLNSSDRNAREVLAYASRPAETDALSLRYYPMEGAGTYFDMASRYQRLLAEEQGMTRSEFGDDLPFYITSYGALERRGSVFWIPADIVVPLTTYSQMTAMLGELRQAGLKGLTVDYRGWQDGGYMGKLPTGGRLESKLGSKKEFAALFDTAQANGDRVFAGVNLVDFYKTGNGFSKSSSVARTVTAAPALQYSYSFISGFYNERLAPWYLLSPLKYGEVLDKVLKKTDYAYAGLGLGTAGSELYSDFRKGGHDRLGIQASYVEAFRKAAQAGPVMADDVNAFLLPYVDYVAGAPAEHSRFDIESRRVPFYQLVLHGYKSYSVPAVNLSADAHTQFLYAAETGASLQYVFNSQNFDRVEDTYLQGIYNSNYRDWQEEAAGYYARLSGLYAQVKGRAIVNHTQPADGVARVDYADGVTVVVNYGKEAYAGELGTVGPEDFAVFQRGEGAA